MAMKKGGLGRGVEALLGSTTAKQVAAGAQARAQQNVFKRACPGQQQIALVHPRDATAKRHVVGCQDAPVGALRRETGNQPQQAGLADTTWPEQASYATGLQCQ